MKKTRTFGLNQWDLTDPIKMEDFNTDNAKLETALVKLQAELAKRPKITFGTYTGNGNYSQTIDLGFTPQAVLVLSFSGQTFYVSDSVGYFSGGLALNDHPVGFQDRKIIEIVNNGFQVFFLRANVGTTYTNLQNFLYHYIAFA